MSMKMTLLVIKSQDVVGLKDFYEALGLYFVEEQHGRGPVHWSCELGPMVLEIYPGDEADSRGLRLGFETDALESRLVELKRRGWEDVSRRRRGSRLGFVIQDPDGRSVEVFEASADAAGSDADQ